PEPHARRAAERVKYMWELEGKLGSHNMDMAHMQHQAPAGDAGFDYLKQEKSPEPAMDGDTLVVHIQTLKAQMRYDRRAFAVGPGMRVRFEFKTPEAMDHNMVLVQPGSAPEVATAAMMLGADGITKSWTPDSVKILWASKVLTMGKSTTIEFTA